MPKKKKLVEKISQSQNFAETSSSFSKKTNHLNDAKHRIITIRIILFILHQLSIYSV